MAVRRIEIGAFPLSDTQEMIARGEIREGKTPVDLLLEGLPRR